MDSGTRVGQTPPETRPPDATRWFATFTILDAGCAISESQFRRLLAFVTKLWRRTVGLPA